MDAVTPYEPPRLRGRAIGLALVAFIGGCASNRLVQDYEAHLASLRDESAIEVAPVLPAGALDPAAVARAVLEHNPRLEAMKATVRAMLARVPQVTAPPDPSLEVGLGPLSVWTGRGQRFAWRQPLAWGARLDAEGEVVLAEADAMGAEREAMGRMLVASAREALLDLAEADAMRAALTDHHRLMGLLKAGVLARYAAAQGRPEDALMADAEVAMVDRELVALGRMEELARLRLGTLLHVAPDPAWTAALPALPDDVPPLETLVAQALAGRPELRAAAARMRAGDAEVRAAEAMGWPMVSVGAEFSTMAEDPMMWPMLMVMVELPFASGRREAMRAEAAAMADASRHAREAVTDEVIAEVGARRVELVAGLDAVAKTRALLDLHTRRVSLVEASYAANRQDFDAVIMARKALLDTRLELIDAERQCRVAQIGLDLAVGRFVGLSPESASIPFTPSAPSAPSTPSGQSSQASPQGPTRDSRPPGSTSPIAAPGNDTEPRDRP